jgi:serine/threonine-protein kinase RsbW
MTLGPTGYPVGTMTDPNLTTGAADAGFTLIDTANARTVAHFRHQLSQWLSAHFALDPMRRNDVLLAVNEALTNVAEFAYRGRRGTMTMEARYGAADDVLLIDVADRGTWRHTDPMTRSNTRGRGIPLMHALADRATISPLPTGTHVQLQFDNCALMTAESYAISF